jgi:hypothetical protein
VAAVPVGSETTRWAFASNQSSVDVGETSDFDFTLAGASSENGTHSVELDIGFDGTTLSQKDNTFTEWYEDSMWLETSQTVDLSREGVSGSMTVSNDTAPDLTELSSGVVAKFYDPNIVEIFFKTDFSRLSVDIHTPDGNVITDCFQRGEEPYVNYLYILQPGWFIEPSNTTKFRSYEIPINQSGSYKMTITNEGESSWSGKFSLYLKSQRMERPYFYWGIIGLVIALYYMIFVAAINIRRGKSDNGLE